MLQNTATFTAIEQKLIALLPPTKTAHLNHAITRGITENRTNWLLQERVFLKAFQHRNSLELTHHFFKNWTSLTLTSDMLISGLMSIVNVFPSSEHANSSSLLDCQQSLLQLMQHKSRYMGLSNPISSPFTQLVNQLCRGEEWQSSTLLSDSSIEWQNYLSTQFDSTNKIIDILLSLALIELIHCAELEISSTLLADSIESSFQLNQYAQHNCAPWFSLHKDRTYYQSAQLALDALEQFIAHKGLSVSEAKVTHKFTEIVTNRHKVFVELAELFDLPSSEYKNQHTLLLSSLNVSL